MGGSVLDLDELVDGQRVGGSMLLFMLVATLALISDGFDLAAMGYVAPELVKAWQIAPSRLVPVFSAGIIGMGIGGPLFGYLGDRFGRKRLIVWGLAVIGVTTLATIAVGSIAQLVVLRLLTGIGLGGVIPNVVALVAEVAPKRIRGRLLVIATLGVAFGITLPGLVAATLVDRFGWQVLLLIGGLVPLGVAAASQYALPESIKYLLQQGGHDEQVRRLARRMRPDLAIGDQMRVSLPAVGPPMRASVRRLFAGDLRWLTPLLWTVQAANQMANFFALTWLPLLLQASGATTAQAGFGASLFSIGGLAGGLVLMFLIDRFGAIPLVFLLLFGAPLVAAIGLPDLPFAVHGAVIAAAGLCVVGVQFGTTALLGLFYPTAIRSTGAGWTQAAGRAGALGAPIAGGMLLDMDVAIRDLLLAPAAALGIGALASIGLALTCYRRFATTRPAEFTGGPAVRDAVLAEAA